MKNRKTRAIAMFGLLCLALVLTASPSAAAQGNGNGNGNGSSNGNGGNGNGNNLPGLSATPELDSLALFGAGAAGMVGYALMRLRAARRQDKNID